MTYMDNEWKILQSINSSSWKEVNLLEGKFSSRVKKLIQHSSSQLSAKTNNEEVKLILFNIIDIYRLIQYFIKWEISNNSFKWFNQCH